MEFCGLRENCKYYSVKDPRYGGLKSEKRGFITCLGRPCSSTSVIMLLARRTDPSFFSPFSLSLPPPCSPPFPRNNVTQQQQQQQCWGENYRGQLGQGDTVERGLSPADMGDNLPTVPLGDFNATAVYSGEEFSCAVDVDGAAKARGCYHMRPLSHDSISYRIISHHVISLTYRYEYHSCTIEMSLPYVRRRSAAALSPSKALIKAIYDVM